MKLWILCASAAILCLLFSGFFILSTRERLENIRRDTTALVRQEKTSHELVVALVRSTLQQSDNYLQLGGTLQGLAARKTAEDAVRALEGFLAEYDEPALRDKSTGLLLSLQQLLKELAPVRDDAELAQFRARVPQVEELLGRIAGQTIESEALLAQEVIRVQREAVRQSERVLVKAWSIVPFALAGALGGGYFFYRRVLQPLDALGRDVTRSLQTATPFSYSGPGLVCRELGQVRDGAVALFHRLEDEVAQRTEQLQESLTRSEDHRHRLAAAEASLQQNLRQLRQVFSVVQSALLLTDDAGIIRLANDYAGALLAVPVDALPGKPLAELLHTVHLLPPDFSLDPTDGPVRRFHLHHPGPGTERFAEIEVACVDEKSGCIVRIDDTTEREIANRNRLRAQRLESIGALAGGIAHDLNNALTPITMGLEHLHATNPSQREVIDSIQQAVRRSTSMVRQVLTFARGAPGVRKAVESSIALQEVFGLVNNTFPRNIRLAKSVAAALDPAMADSTQLNQVLVNLCVNARDAMPAGGTLTVGARNRFVTEAEVAGRPEAKAGRFVEFFVADTGTGISPEILPKIFEPFFTTKEPGSGTGLGLSSCMGIVRTHGGFFEVDSKEGKGTTFRVLFPAAENAGKSASAPPHPPVGRTLDGQGLGLLFVDDQDVVRDAVHRQLTRCNFKVILAADGVEALRALAQRRTEIQLVITDLSMPHLDGRMLLVAMNEAGYKLPIMVASAMLTDEEKAEFHRLGVYHFLNKPFGSSELAHELQKMLRTLARKDGA